MTTTRPAFLITIDTEGDDAWAPRREVTTENARWLPRFQALCERFDFKPTYLVDHAMAMDRRFVAFARDAVDRGAAEVGMHLHAWHSPPPHALSADDHRHKPYLIEYPTRILQAKIRSMTARLEDVFGRKVVSHRAGRWAVDARYVAALIDAGYLVDCSVTPWVSWRGHAGTPGGRGGVDYRHYRSTPYLVDPEDPSRTGTSPLLEVPMTIMPRRAVSSRAVPSWAYASRLTTHLMNRILPHEWLRPRRGNRARMLQLVGRAVAEGRSHLEFMTHSSELMPGGGPHFRDEASIDALYLDLEALFAAIARDFAGVTLATFRRRWG